MRFYVVHTVNSRERRVKELLEKAIESQGLSQLFGRVIDLEVNLWP